jgi:hypothetical protein
MHKHSRRMPASWRGPNTECSHASSALLAGPALALSAIQHMAAHRCQLIGGRTTCEDLQLPDCTAPAAQLPAAIPPPPTAPPTPTPPHHYRGCTGIVHHCAAPSYEVLLAGQPMHKPQRPGSKSSQACPQATPMQRTRCTRCPVVSTYLREIPPLRVRVLHQMVEHLDLCMAVGDHQQVAVRWQCPAPG